MHLLFLFLLLTPFQGQASSIAEGKRLITIMGCNDCHTPRFGESGGAIPEKDWLTGSPVGFKGPWGTSYPSNLRNTVSHMKEEHWVQYLKDLRTRPPMPSYTVNALTASESKSIYLFIKSLGDHPFTVPDALAPGAVPRTPYIVFEPVLPIKK